MGDAKCRCASGGEDGGNDGGSGDDYTYGDDCATLRDDDCALVSGCSQCSWSWPSNDPAQWDSSDAKCRCASGGNDDNDGDNNTGGDDYVYGGDCQTLTDDDCGLVSGCSQCNWSWPSSDPAQWNSADAKCRCQSESNNDNDGSADDYEFGGD